MLILKTWHLADCTSSVLCCGTFPGIFPLFQPEEKSVSSVLQTLLGASVSNVSYKILTLEKHFSILLASKFLHHTASTGLKMLLASLSMWHATKFPTYCKLNLHFLSWEQLVGIMQSFRTLIHNWVASPMIISCAKYPFLERLRPQYPQKSLLLFQWRIDYL